MDNIEHSSRLSIASNAVLEGSEPTSVFYDGEGYYVFADDIDLDEFIKFLEREDIHDFREWIPRVKPVCLHCVIELHPSLLEKLHIAQQEGAWSKNDDVFVYDDTDDPILPDD